jgi:hypothetical protein
MVTRSASSRLGSGSSPSPSAYGSSPTTAMPSDARSSKRPNRLKATSASLASCSAWRKVVPSVVRPRPPCQLTDQPPSCIPRSLPASPAARDKATTCARAISGRGRTSAVGSASRSSGVTGRCVAAMALNASVRTSSGSSVRASASWMAARTFVSGSIVMSSRATASRAAGDAPARPASRLAQTRATARSAASSYSSGSRSWSQPRCPVFVVWSPRVPRWYRMTGASSYVADGSWPPWRQPPNRSGEEPASPAWPAAARPRAPTRRGAPDTRRDVDRERPGVAIAGGYPARPPGAPSSPARGLRPCRDPAGLVPYAAPFCGNPAARAARRLSGRDADPRAHVASDDAPLPARGRRAEARCAAAMDAALRPRRPSEPPSSGPDDPPEDEIRQLR